jgi:hypothetical protein
LKPEIQYLKIQPNRILTSVFINKRPEKIKIELKEGVIKDT